MQGFGGQGCQTCTAFPGSHVVILMACIFQKMRGNAGTAAHTGNAGTAAHTGNVGAAAQHKFSLTKSMLSGAAMHDA